MVDEQPSEACPHCGFVDWHHTLCPVRDGKPHGELHPAEGGPVLLVTARNPVERAWLRLKAAWRARNENP